MRRGTPGEEPKAHHSTSITSVSSSRGSLYQNRWLFAAETPKKNAAEQKQRKETEERKSKAQGSKYPHPGAGTSNETTEPRGDPVHVRLPAVTIPVRVRDSAERREIRVDAITGCASAVIIEDFSVCLPRRVRNIACHASGVRPCSRACPSVRRSSRHSWAAWLASI